MKLGVVMDPIETINFKKDSTLAMMIEAQRKNHEIFYMTPNSLFINSGISYANTSKIEVRNDPLDWFSLEEPQGGEHEGGWLLRAPGGSWSPQAPLRGPPGLLEAPGPFKIESPNASE